jgi:hypothetical protein
MVDYQEQVHGRLLNQEQAGAILLASTRKLQALRERGSGPPYMRVGRSILYPEKLLVEWFKSQLARTQGGANEHRH